MTGAARRLLDRLSPQLARRARAGAARSDRALSSEVRGPPSADPRAPHGYLIHIESEESQLLELDADGSSMEHGESTCVSAALWSGEGVGALSLRIAPDDIEGAARLLAAALDGVSMVPGDPPPSFPAGRFGDERVPFRGLAARWRPPLLAALAASDGRAALLLSLERRRVWLQDHLGRRGQFHGHRAQVQIRWEDGKKSASITLPLPSPAPQDLRPHVRWVKRHAEVGAAPGPGEGRGPVLLGPVAVAQLLCMWGVEDDVGELLSQAALPTGVYPGDSASEATFLARLVHHRPLPELGYNSFFVPAGTLRARPRAPGLLLWHCEEIVKRRGLFSVLASGERWGASGARPKAFSGARLALPRRVIVRALGAPARRGDRTTGLRIGRVDFHAPTLLLGELRWD